jgi:hypothetical protein
VILHHPISPAEEESTEETALALASVETLTIPWQRHAACEHDLHGVVYYVVRTIRRPAS